MKNLPETSRTALDDASGESGSAVELVTIDHVRACGLCASGARRWFESHGLDFRDFLKHGVPAAVILETGDGFGALVVARMRAAHVARLREGANRSPGQGANGPRITTDANGVRTRLSGASVRTAPRDFGA